MKTTSRGSRPRLDPHQIVPKGTAQWSSRWPATDETPAGPLELGTPPSRQTTAYPEPRRQSGLLEERGWTCLTPPPANNGSLRTRWAIEVRTRPTAGLG